MNCHLGIELVHEDVVRGLQKGNQSVNDQVLETIERLLGEVGVEADGLDRLPEGFFAKLSYFC